MNFSSKFEGDFNFFVDFVLKGYILKFFLYCPLPYSLPSGSSANLTARRFAPSCTKLLTIIKRVYKSPGHYKKNRSTLDSEKS